ncbi:hypothetical protein BH09BAC2_BH09BAC2_10310 [soil metagenome]
MNKIIIPAALLMSGFLFSCNNAENNKEPNKNEAALAEVYKGFETGDMSLLDKNIADDAVDHNGGPMGGEIKGRDKIKAMATAMHGSVTGLKMEVESQASEGNTVFALIHMTGTTSANPDPSMGMPPNTKMDMRSVDVVKFNSDGKATDHWGYMDAKDMMAMMHPPTPRPDSTTMMNHNMTDSMHKK